MQTTKYKGQSPRQRCQKLVNSLESVSIHPSSILKQKSECQVHREFYCTPNLCISNFQAINELIQVFVTGDIKCKFDIKLN